eukprot:TCALIF_10360-PA protein Name:"Similar to Pkd2l1 Polycystic kidney disease 2-like 1 protein (Mus musculus)" AED:0.18 eAED:0.18 QI:118/0.86/1/1/0.8/0.75/16/1264/740
MGDVEEGFVGSRPTSSNMAERAQTAGNIVRAMSRPSSGTKSVAWSEDVPPDPEAGNLSPIKEIDPALKEEAPYSKELEEELNRDPMEDKENITVGCWAQFTAMVSSMWDTTDMAVGEEREVLVRTTLRELVVYLVYLVILCCVTLSAMSPTMYRYTEIVSSTFKSQYEVRQISDFWEFMEGEFFDGIYLEQWYNDGDETATYPCPGHPNVTGPCPIDHQDRMVMHANRLLGVPRLRQIRVRNDSCTIPTEFKDSVDVCYDHYSSTIEDENPFGPGYRKYTSADAWRYQSVKELEGKLHWGMEATYSGAGSVQNLREKRNETQAILKELKEGLWIGRGTRYISLDFTLYNANINLFCVIKMNFEFPPTGGIIPTTQFGTVKLLRYITPFEYALMGLEVVFAVFVAYYVVEEVIELSMMGLQYFTTFWNFLDLFMISVSVATLSFNLYLFTTVTGLLKSLLAEPELFADFSFLEFWSKTFQDAAALTVFTGWIKVFKYISFNKTMSQLSGTITRCASDVAAFSIMFFIVFFAYAQIGYLLFGVHVGDYISRGYNNVREMFFSRDKILDIKATVKLAADDGVVTYDEIRENLRKLNFSDLEIEMFCSRYDRDGNFEFTLEEINAIEQDEGDRFDNYNHLYLTQERPKSSVERPSSGLPKMTRRDFDMVHNRVDRMEEQMSSVVTKVNEVLQKLDTFDGEARKSSAQAINRGIRHIASAAGNDEDKRKEMEKLVHGELEKIEDD